MNPAPDAIIVLTTCSSESDRDTLIAVLLDAKLAACIQVSSIRSHYVWKGERASEDEFQLMIKAKSALFERVEACIKSVHTYKTPEILAMPVVAGSAEYLSWLAYAVAE